MNTLTAIIVSFFRVEYLEKCLESLRKQYPDIKILVGNNGPEDTIKEGLCKKYQASYFQLPFDCGLCFGRNFLIDHAETDYILVGDDDFYYTKDARVDLLLDLVSSGKADLAGGRIREGGVLRNYQGFIDENDRNFVYRPLCGEDVDAGEPIQVDITFNYFVAKTDTVRSVKWDEQIKVSYEHSAFFIDFKRAGFKTYFHPGAIVDHKPAINKKNPVDYEKYRVFRTRKSDKKRFFERFDIDYTIDMGGRKDVFDRTGMSNISFIVSTFGRPGHLERLMLSIAKYAPNARVLIGDQNKKFDASGYREMYEKLFAAGLINKPTAYNLPFDCGLSYSRNYLAEQAKTDYCLLLEDDFVFTENTRAIKMFEFLEDHQQFGVIGGMVTECGFPINFEGYWLRDMDEKTCAMISDLDQYQERNDLKWKETGCVLNFALFRRQMLMDVRWDEEIKIHGEHIDFYLRARDKGWKTAYTPDISIKHVKERDDEYKEYRGRREFLKIMMKKNNIKKLIYLNGRTLELTDDGQIIKSRA